MTTETPNRPRSDYHREWREAKRAAVERGEAEVPHGAAGYHIYKCRCDVCRRAAVASNHAYLSQTPPGSGRNNGSRWSVDEDEVVTARRPDSSYELNVREAAELLGRTLSAVNSRRSVLRRSAAAEEAGR